MTDDDRTVPLLYAIFDPDGVPGWIGRTPIDGAEALPAEIQIGAVLAPVTVRLLAAHRRLPGGAWVRRDPPPAPSDAELAAQAAAELQAVQAAAGQQIDAMVAEARLRFVTALPGQEAIYLAKEAEARAYVATVPEPDNLDDYPYLAAEVGLTAASPMALATLWLQRGALFRALGAATEGWRMTARRAVQMAARPEDVDAALQALAAGLSALG